MGKRYTKFNSNYLMRSQHQHTDLGTLMERDWVTTNGLNVLRFGSGRKIWYNSGNFVFTTGNIPTYHKKHKLSTETTEWGWDDCKSADSTVNTVMPSFNTTDLRDYAYYGSCVELVRATIEEIISDFPGNMNSTTERPIVDGENVSEWYKDVTELNKLKPTKDDVSYCAENDTYYYYDNGWKKAVTVNEERDILDDNNKKVGTIYYIKKENEVCILLSKMVKDKPLYYTENYGNATNLFSMYYVHNELKYYSYDYKTEKFIKATKITGLVDGYYLDNPFQIDLHHKKVSIDKYDNPMRYMGLSWSKYCVKVKRKKDAKGECCCGSKEYDKENCLFEGNVVGYTIEDKEQSKCASENEGKILKVITFKTDNNNIQNIKVYGYYLDGSIVYVYKPSQYGEYITIQPQQEYIDEYFNSLTGFKKQLLRQDTKPLYMNKLITPTEYNFIWYYPEKTYIWPSNGYCIDVNSSSFISFVNKLYDNAQNFDELWSDNLYRSMTHESIKNFDWTYSREYYEGEEQDNVDGGERMQKIIRVFGRVFDDAKTYMDALKLTTNTTYDQYKNGPEALLSDSCNLKGIDVKSTISTDYDNDTNITSEFLDTIDKKYYREWHWIDKDGKEKEIKTKSTLSKWYPTRNSTDIYTDVADNEFMRRLLLSSKRIMQSKGTQESIEMVFGMFGFGKDIDYTLTEETYYTEKMIRSEECVDGKIDGDATYTGEDWTNTPGVDWKSVNSHQKGDLANEINRDKLNDLLYFYEGDTLSGVPLREVLLGREKTPYLVPYYDNTQIYDGDLIFQGKGGWGKMIKENDDDPLDDSLDYQETLSYLHVVGNISELLVLNEHVVENNDIYYVVNLTDYSEYDENPPIDIDKDITMSHYFILIDKGNVNRLYGWKNIVVKASLDEEGNLVKVDKKEDFESIFGYKLDTEIDLRDWKFEPDNDGTETDEEKLGTYKYAFKKMQYLDSIFSTNVGNNPHVGYGQYDDGLTYIEYMKLPFKYSLDNVNIDNYNLTLLAEKYKFDDIGEKVVNDKIQLMNSRQKDNESDFVNYTIENGEIKITPSLKDDEHNVEKRWYINNKVLTIENKVIDNSKEHFFNNYFKTIIMPYIMQVIPSTTILKLKGFS